MNLRVSQRIMAISLVAITGFVAIGVVVVWSRLTQQRVLEQKDNATVKLSLSRDVEELFLDSRRREKDFLIRRNLKYVESHAVDAAAIYGALDQLEGMAAAQEMPLVTEVRERYRAYEAQFADVVQTVTALGLDEKSGLRGALRGSVHDAEKLIKEHASDDLMVKLLMMRRHEKDFIIRKNLKYVGRLADRIAEFSILLDTKAVADPIKADITAALDSYKADFDRFAALTQDGQEKVANLSKLFALADPPMEELSKVARANFDVVEADAKKRSSDMFAIALGILAAVSLACVVLGFWVGRSISRPMTTLTERMRRLAEGDNSVDFQGTERSDEVGEMARATLVFKQNAIEAERMREESAARERRMTEEKREEMRKLANAFKSSVGKVIDGVSTSASELQDTAKSMTSTAEQTNALAVSVAGASEEASTNVQTVASASEELSASIAEISRQIGESSSISRRAVDTAEMTNGRVAELSSGATKIGDIVSLIRDIAEQTNLLALNATIEAARAGDAGKGFAVVASEVKNLATQTAKATEEIATQVTAMQGATSETVSAIEEITAVIRQISENASGIVSAVEQQNASTQEIARNVQEAASGTNEVTTTISEVSSGAESTGAAASQVLSRSQALSEQSHTLRAEVDRFMAGLEAA